MSSLASQVPAPTTSTDSIKASLINFDADVITELSAQGLPSDKRTSSSIVMLTVDVRRFERESQEPKCSHLLQERHGLGPLLSLRRDRIGAEATAGFVDLRRLNIYTDPTPCDGESEMAFFRVCKYPPSLADNFDTSLCWSVLRCVTLYDAGAQ